MLHRPVPRRGGDRSVARRDVAPVLRQQRVVTLRLFLLSLSRPPPTLDISSSSPPGMCETGMWLEGTRSLDMAASAALRNERVSEAWSGVISHAAAQVLLTNCCAVHISCSSTRSRDRSGTGRSQSRSRPLRCCRPIKHRLAGFVDSRRPPRGTGRARSNAYVTAGRDSIRAVHLKNSSSRICFAPFWSTAHVQQGPNHHLPRS